MLAQGVKYLVMISSVNVNLQSLYVCTTMGVRTGQMAILCYVQGLKMQKNIEHVIKQTSFY